MIKMNRKYIDKTFDECFQEFLLEHCTLKNMREDTKKYYIENMKYGFYKYYDKDTNIDKFTQDDINGYILYLQNKDIKDTTINIYLKALKTIIIFYKKKFWIDINIAVMLVKEGKQQVEGYTDEEIAVLIKKANMKEITFAQCRNWVIVNFLMKNNEDATAVLDKFDIEIDSYANISMVVNQITSRLRNVA